MFDEGNAFKWELVLGKGSGFMNGLCKIVRDWRSLEKFFATMKISLTITLCVMLANIPVPDSDLVHTHILIQVDMLCIGWRESRQSRLWRTFQIWTENAGYCRYLRVNELIQTVQMKKILTGR